MGFSPWWLLLLCGTGSRARELSSCSSRALDYKLNSCGTWAELLLGMWDLPGSGNQIRVSCTGRQILYHWATREAHHGLSNPPYTPLPCQECPFHLACSYLLLRTCLRSSPIRSLTGPSLVWGGLPFFWGSRALHVYMEHSALHSVTWLKFSWSAPSLTWSIFRTETISRSCLLCLAQYLAI